MYYLGIDGGGTKTAYMLVDENSNVVQEYQGENCNPVDIGMEAAKERLTAGISRVCAGIPPAHICLFAGIAGGTSFTFQRELADFFQTFGFAAFENDSDNRNIVATGLGKADGISLILGTGVCAYRQKNGQCKRFSGWGYLFDNGGSAYNIGRDGLAAHFEALDGVGAPTKISEMIEEKHSNPQMLLQTLYGGGKKGIAAYAPLVYQAASAGDTVAMAILKRNMSHAATVVEAAANELTEQPIPVVVAGGLTAQPLTLELLMQALHRPQRFQVKILRKEPVMGAVLLAQEIAEEKRKQPI